MGDQTCWWVRNPKQPPGMVLKPVVNNGINYQPQLVSRISEPSTVWMPQRGNTNQRKIKDGNFYFFLLTDQDNGMGWRLFSWRRDRKEDTSHGSPFCFHHFSPLMSQMSDSVLLDPTRQLISQNWLHTFSLLVAFNMFQAIYLSFTRPVYLLMPIIWLDSTGWFLTVESALLYRPLKADPLTLPFRATSLRPHKLVYEFLVINHLIQPPDFVGSKKREPKSFGW